MKFPSQEHINAAISAANRLQTETHHYVWPSVTLAQACIESDNWTRLTGKNNGFGIKAKRDQIDKGDATSVWTHEIINGKRLLVKQEFANFASLDDAYYEHAKLLAEHRTYLAGWHTHTADSFIRAIAPHYATAPDYAHVIIHTMLKLNLYQYNIT